MYERSEITRMVVLRISNGRRGESEARLAPSVMLARQRFFCPQTAYRGQIKGGF
jgi:hypothetical protein